MKTIIKNIAELIQTEDAASKWVAGKDMLSISTIKDAFVKVENGIIEVPNVPGLGVTIKEDLIIRE